MRTLPFSFLLLFLGLAVAMFPAPDAASALGLTVSGRNPVLLSWPTNRADYVLQTRTNLSSGLSWQDWTVTPSIIGSNYVATNTFNDSSRFFRLHIPDQVACLNQLINIGICSRLWAGDYGDQFPFEIPTILGGTREFRAIGPDGFDTNAYIHFQVMSNDFAFPQILVCPSDKTRSAATNFANLRPENVTYKLRTGDSVYPDAPGEILAVCPIHGNTLYCDWTVVAGSN